LQQQVSEIPLGAVVTFSDFGTGEKDYNSIQLTIIVIIIIIKLCICV